MTKREADGLGRAIGLNGKNRKIRGYNGLKPWEAENDDNLVG